ncbi:hypothetical protein [Leminorella grimontii]|uniref:hypothetical protein n=1 Tax=Leminorella grimontii TaxID=82981 RepID=UPI00048175DA|nr:hypothetical protein [Leminorella grimontii]KFC92765.1 hypothetical protein GLGR_3640 [Leminorella grimontii ATCC 33999 = DSM 5078]VFS62379.1 Protein of uncharacterised function (DUF3298) [Leminorella grimontii]
MKNLALALFAACLWLSSFFPAYADGEHRDVYLGTIGAQSVVVELSVEDEPNVTGRYFYQRYRNDIALSGVRSADGSFTLYENRQVEKNPSAMTLSPGSDGSLKGEWRGVGGKRLVVNLTPQPQLEGHKDDTLYLQALRRENPYDYQRIAASSLMKEREQTFMGYRLQWWREPVSGIRLFSVLSGYPQASLKKINAHLRDRLWKEVVNYHSCLYGGLQTSVGQADFTQTVTPTYFSENVLSAKVFTHFYCGGAHPDFGDFPINLDVKQARELSLEDVLWLGKGEPVYYDAQGSSNSTFSDFSDYRSHILAPWLVKKMSELHPKSMLKNEECDYHTQEYWAFVNWHFTSEGILFSPSFPRVARSCEYPEWATIPYREIKRHPGRFSFSD